MFRRKRAQPEDVPPDRRLTPVEEVPDSHKAVHGQYTIIPRTKRLNSGKFIVRIVLEEERPEGPRRYDFAGPMKEYETEELARQAGIANARRRIDDRAALEASTRGRESAG